MIVPSLYLDLLRACHEPGCPVCRLVNGRVDDYLRGLFYEKVNDVSLRQRLRASRGFCNEHAWSALRPGVGDGLGISIIYHDIFTNILRDLPGDQAGSNERAGKRHPLSTWLSGLASSVGDMVKSILAAFSSQGPCLACVQRDELTALLMQELVKAVQREEGRQALAESSGLCLPHLRILFRAPLEPAIVADLLGIVRRQLQALDAELTEYIRKNDYRYQGETFGAERDAWKRAIAKAAGEPGPGT